MVLPLAQKTCCKAAHSASAQVSTIASAAGRLLEAVPSRVGAIWPILLQSMMGSAGVFAMVGAKPRWLADANSRAGL